MYTRHTMPELLYRLRSHDLGFLEIVAEFWGLELQAPDVRSALPFLTKAMLDQRMVEEVVEALPKQARHALDLLLQNDGKIPWSGFVREFGELREVGPGKRDREKPYLEPISSTEILWYRGLIGREFFQHEGEAQEFAYIPDDLLALLPAVVPAEPQLPGRAATAQEYIHITIADDQIIDHTCTLLAALRLGDPQRSPAVKNWQPPYYFVHALLAAVKLITSSEQPVAEDARPFLEMQRGESLGWLFRSWRESRLFSELKLMPELICDGQWQNDPRTAREFLIEKFSEIPADAWWHLDSFIDAINQQKPDFQRPAGDFDSWLIRDTGTGKSLKGIKHWHEVDGSLIRYMITGPMHWLGLIDLAAKSPDSPVSAFRLSGWSEQLLLGTPVNGLADEDQTIESTSDGQIKVGLNSPRIARYQVSRFCLWVDETSKHYIYQVSPTSLTQAAEQGLKVAHLEALLKKYGSPPPPSLMEALMHWEEKGSQAKIGSYIVLQVASPDILKALRETPANRFLGEPLGPTSVIVNPGAEDKIAKALARLGYLSDLNLGSGGHRQSGDPAET